MNTRINFSFTFAISLFCFFFLPLVGKSEVLWADSVLGFSTQISPVISNANQVLGKPSLYYGFGESPCAWSPATDGNKNDEWIKVKYNHPLFVQQIAVNENFNPGCISNIFLYDENGKEYSVYTNDKFSYLDSTSRYFTIKIPKTYFKAIALKLVMKTARIPGFNQIDAIGISDDEQAIPLQINMTDQYKFTAVAENLGPMVNTIYHDRAPIISFDGSYLYFTRSGDPKNFGDDKWDDIWYSKIDSNGKFSKAVNIAEPLNNNKSNFVISISPSGTEMIVGNVYKEDGTFLETGVSKSSFDGKNWGVPKKLNIKNFKNNSKFQSYCLSGNGKVLILAIEHEITFGGTDLYVSFLDSNDSWSSPINMGKIINSASDESAPFIAADGITMYFSTAGFPGYGKNDIFMTKRLDSTWTNWSVPKNLGPSINSRSYDSFFSIPANGEFAYFCSLQKSYGCEDIFRIKLPEEIKPNPVVLISGIVRNQKTNQPMEAKIRLEDLKTGKEIGIATSNPLTGEYKIILPAGVNYGFRAEVDGFIAQNESLNLKQVDKYDEAKKDLVLAPIEAGIKITLNNIFFDFKDFNLLPESFPELNRVVKVMTDNKEIVIEVQGHTDNVGTQERNLALSKKRAESVASYIISKGISQERVKSIGFGKLKPKVSNDTEEGRTQNRRVEFQIIKSEK